MPRPEDLPREVAELCHEFRTGLRLALGDDLMSLYLYGSLAFPRPESWAVDIDFHALLRQPMTDDQRKAVSALHRRLADSSALGKELDGYYILMADAAGSEPPVSQVGAATDDAWALHRAHVLAGRFVLLEGPDPREILVPPAWPEIEHALRAELAYIERRPEHAAFRVLNACRILYSVRTRDVVVSKYDAAQWGLDNLPSEWRAPVAAAVRCYSRTASPEDRALVASSHADLVALLQDELR